MLECVIMWFYWYVCGDSEIDDNIYHGYCISEMREVMALE